MNRKETVVLLSSTLKKTLAAFAWDAKTLKRSYGKGKWSGKEILGHLTDCELVFLYRLQFMLAEENPAVFAFDENKWAGRFSYAKQDLGAMKARFAATRARFVELAKECTDADWARKGTRPDNPDYTLGYLVEHAAEHNEHHLEQLACIRAGKEWVRPAE